MERRLIRKEHLFYSLGSILIINVDYKVTFTAQDTVFSVQTGSNMRLVINTTALKSAQF